MRTAVQWIADERPWSRALLSSVWPAQRRFHLVGGQSSQIAAGIARGASDGWFEICGFGMIDHGPSTVLEAPRRMIVHASRRSVEIDLVVEMNNA